VIALLLLTSVCTDVVYPLGYSCDPVSGILYDRCNGLPTGCRVDIETGIISCVGGAPGIPTAVVAIPL
jgi:hypothetical protein